MAGDVEEVPQEVIDEFEAELEREALDYEQALRESLARHDAEADS